METNKNTEIENQLPEEEQVTTVSAEEEQAFDEAAQEALMAAEKAAKAAARKAKFWKEVKEWISSLVFAVVIVLICQNFLFTLIRVDGASMNPTLLDGERLFVTVADVKFGKVQRDSVVICHYPNRGRTFFVKRVVGVPGDTVYRQYSTTHILYETTDENGQTVTVDNILDENNALAYYLYGYAEPDYEPYVLGEDEYFVVGDNRYNSHDSRDWNDNDPSRDVGPISKDMIVGRVRQVIWPLNAIREVEAFEFKPE